MWSGINLCKVGPQVAISAHTKAAELLRKFGQNLKSARVKAGLRQIDIDERCGVAYRHYQNIEAVKVNVTIETLFRLANFFKVNVIDLVKDE